MKTLGVFLALLCGCTTSMAQTPLSQVDALKQMYEHYDATEHTASLSCTDAHKVENSKIHGSWWPCYKEDSVVSVQVILTASFAIWTGPKQKTNELFLVTSAVPAHDPSGFDCHSCEPAIGVARFVWLDSEWKLESANETVGFYGSWGAPPFLNLMAIGPSHYGILLSKDGGGQGYGFGSKWLLAPVGKTFAEVWNIQDEQDDFGAYDPKGADGPSIQYRSAAAIRFSCIFDDSCANGNGYFDIEVISRGRDESGPKSELKPQNWTDVYQLREGKYKLARHQQFIETEAVQDRGQKKP